MASSRPSTPSAPGSCDIRPITSWATGSPPARWPGTTTSVPCYGWCTGCCSGSSLRTGRCCWIRTHRVPPGRATAGSSPLSGSATPRRRWTRCWTSPSATRPAGRGTSWSPRHGGSPAGSPSCVAGRTSPRRIWCAWRCARWSAGASTAWTSTRWPPNWPRCRCGWSRWNPASRWRSWTPTSG